MKTGLAPTRRTRCGFHEKREQRRKNLSSSSSRVRAKPAATPAVRQIDGIKSFDTIRDAVNAALHIKMLM